MKRNDFKRQICKSLQKVAKVNLLSALNENVARPVNNFIKHEILDLQKNKISAKHKPHAALVDKENLPPAGKGNNSVASQLKGFQKKHRPSAELMGDVVKLLTENGVSVPDNFDLRPPAFVQMSLTFGEYLHFGVEAGLRDQLQVQGRLQNGVKLLLDIGFFFQSPTADDNGQQPRFLLILGRTNLKPCDTPFVIGVYRGRFPDSRVPNEILRPLVDELQHIGERSALVELGAFICDPVAKSLVTCTALPDTKVACGQCHVDREGHRTGESILRRLNVDLAAQIAIDYRHTVVLGVMKTLWRLWTNGKLDYRLNKAALRSMAQQLQATAAIHTPREFRRRLPALETATDTWDAYDWRQFLLYYAPIVLRDHLPAPYYKNFAVLSAALNFLLGIEHATLEMMAGQLLHIFLLQFAELYDADLVDSNFHCLMHIEQMTRVLGPLESLGGYQFDELLDVVVDFSRRPDIDLERLGHQIVETTQQMVENRTNKWRDQRPEPYASDEGVHFKKFMLSTAQADDCFLTTDGRICKVERWASDSETGDVLIVGREFTGTTGVCGMPWEKLTRQCAWRVYDLAAETQNFRATDVRSKLVKVEAADGLFVVPLCSF